ncbi:TonB-dependent receptor [Pseudoalteromonas xiamenensis]|uniref:TonB-dependent receptor n=1 Tax=Pseudoalteromonas xiamenensis TaxID=882626 RepID=A0A975HP78_9GAMM|nr:TonB-dependent receptor [Pseudoalteromonas xiamenensis]QTH72985.1 TonB-dependent receptor [Pseudoalteromonas xiamenensis]
MIKNRIAKSVNAALALGAATSSVLSMGVFAAQEESEKVERIEITGSAIKRTDLEGSLPIQIIDSADIEKSGMSSVPELIASLPAMQGFTTEGESVGGGGGGIQTASLRDLGESYTLVLVNGRRQVSADSGGAVDINAIPLSAIKRVEILTDGASALYGSDAIAGVVNFILKDDVQETTITARYSKPKDTYSANFSITTGFGDISSDGYNIVLSYSHDQKDSLRAADRDFARTGFVQFEHGGQDLVAIAGSSNAIPGNAYISYYDPDDLDGDGRLVESLSFNPYKETTGQCHSSSAPSGTACQFDYTSTLEIQPESKRDNVYAKADFVLADDLRAFASASLSNYSLTARIAPYPTGTFTLDSTSDLVAEYVLPHLTDYQKSNLKEVAARWRTLPGGNRTDEFETKTAQLVAGISGEVSEWSYDATISHGKATRDNNRITGYPLDEEFRALLASGQLNIFVPPEEMSEDQNKLVKGTMFNGNWDKTETSLTSFEAKASGVVAELDSGSVYVGFGIDYRKQQYSVSISDANKNEVVFLDSKGDEFDLERDMYGAFAEVVVPVVENLEVTASLRYDNIGATSDSKRTGEKTVGSSQNDTTYKISAAYRPTEQWLLRASYGTGFKAPTMRQIAEPRIEFGVTSAPYDCPAGLPADKAQYCWSDKLQYDVYREGNGDLKPEKSTQYTLGFVWSGDTGTSFSLDYWNIEMKDQVDRLTQDQIFFNAALYKDLFVTKIDKGTGNTTLAILQAPSNVGKSENSGIDWSLDLTNELAIGTWKFGVQGTYMIESQSLRVGSDDVWETSLGKVGTNAAVTFRNIVRITNSLTYGDFTHALYINGRSGYTDAAADISFYVAEADNWDNAVDGSLILKHVDAYFTMDYQLKYNLTDDSDVAFGVRNLMDKKPPFTLNASAGHQVGYDPRYADPYGRTLYVQANYKF